MTWSRGQCLLHTHVISLLAVLERPCMTRAEKPVNLPMMMRRFFWTFCMMFAGEQLPAGSTKHHSARSVKALVEQVEMLLVMVIMSVTHCMMNWKSSLPEKMAWNSSRILASTSLPRHRHRPGRSCRGLARSRGRTHGHPGRLLLLRGKGLVLLEENGHDSE